MKVVRGSLNSEPFQSMSTSREFLCAASQGPNIVVATVDCKIKEILTFAPLSASGNYAITGKLVKILVPINTILRFE